MTHLPHIAAVLAVVALSSSSIVKSPSDDGKNFELLILHNNDMHARFEQTSQLSGTCTIADREAGKCYGGFPRVAHVVKEARKAAASGEGPPVLYLNAGDTYTGTAWFTVYKWKVAAEFLNALQPDAVSLGNHEFDNGVSGLTPFIRNLSCPVLAANLILSNEPTLEAEKNLMKSIVFNINGTKIGIIGYLTPETKTLAIGNNVEYIEEVAAIREELNRLKNQGVQVFIALGHSGFHKDLEIAEKVEDIDLVIGGHTNTFLWNGKTIDSETPQGPYPTLVKQRSGRMVPVVQAYAYTKYLGKLHLLINSYGEIISFDGNPILLDNSVPQDPSVLAIVNAYHENVVKISEVVVASASVLLDGLSCRLQECNLGNLITDAMVDKYASEYIGIGWTDAPIAVMQGGGIRASISHPDRHFNITKGDLYTVIPFGGKLVKLTIKGSKILKMLEHSVASYNIIRSPGQFLQVSGLKVLYDFKRPSGARVVQVLVLCGICEIPTYEPLNKTKEYNILTNGFLAMGGDGFSVFNGLPFITLNYNELLCTVDYMNKTRLVHPAVEGRIIIRNANAISVAVTTTGSFVITLFALFWSLGNHEFDENVDGVIPFIKNLSSPVVTANLVLNKVPEFVNISNLYNSIVINKNGIRIGIIGYLTPETKLLAPVNDVEYEDEILALNREVKKLKELGIKILIALGHSGYLKDLEIAGKVDDIDLVIGGHSNTFLLNSNSTNEKPEQPQGPYPTLVKQKSGRTVPVVQAYAFTKYLGKLHLIFNGNGEIIKCDGEPILLNKDIPEDSEVLEIVKKYQKDIDRINKEVVGTSLVFLDGDSCRLRECNMGNLINDAVLNYTKNYYKNSSNSYISIIQGGRIRISVDGPEKPFNVTKGDLITVMPFSDTLTVLTMNGTVLNQVLEHSVASWRKIDTPGQFLQYSGVEVVYDLAQKAGSRIVKATAICSTCSNLSDIQEDYEYKVIAPIFLAEGGDGFTMFKELPSDKLPYNELECTLNYLTEHSPVEPLVYNRIIVLNEDKVQSIPDINIISGNKNGVPSNAVVIQFNYITYLLTVIFIYYRVIFM